MLGLGGRASSKQMPDVPPRYDLTASKQIHDKTGAFKMDDGMDEDEYREFREIHDKARTPRCMECFNFREYCVCRISLQVRYNPLNHTALRERLGIPAQFRYPDDGEWVHRRVRFIPDKSVDNSTVIMQAVYEDVEVPQWLERLIHPSGGFVTRIGENIGEQLASEVEEWLRNG